MPDEIIEMSVECRRSEMPALPMTLLERGFALRAEADADIDFLRRLYASTRSEELAMTAWSDAEKQAFCDIQFQLQRHHYRTYYPETDWWVLEEHGVPAGRLYLDRQTNTLLVIDIALLPQWRGRGVGTELMLWICAQARAAGKSVTIAVEKFNRAQTLYRRLGFRETSDAEVYWFMEWRSPADSPAPIS
jgi:GNAT superfamily N-acetyltransferase